MISKRTFLLLLISLISCLSARSQTSGAGINEIISSVDTLRSRMPAEKLYIQFDKPYYSVGDTMRLKAYLFDAAFLRGSEKSGLVYIELANDTNKVLLRRMLPVAYGLGSGNLVLNNDVPEGSYTIRAYTNLMRNFGEDLVFKKNFYVSSNSAHSWLVSSKSMLSRKSGKDNLRLDLQFNQFNKEALRMHDLELRVLEGKKVLLRDKVQTDEDGKLDVNFNLPEKADAKNISIIAVDPKDDTRKLTIPIPVNRPENIDLQFMPEGGSLVNGIISKIGFKAIGEDGKATEVSGKVYNKTEEVTSFKSSYKGMGSFEFMPKEGETYTAKVIVNGITKDFPLPALKNSGTTIRINNPIESDSVEVIVSSNLPSTASAYYLIAQSRGIVCYGAVIRFNGNVVKKNIAKSLFPTGIARFTLMNADRQPLNERITFVDHHDNLEIKINPDKPTYKTRDSIALAIEVKDHEGKPVQGSFSMAVTDDSQVKTDSLGNDILTDILLTSGLKGSIEDPGHYLLASTQAAADLDNLLLTQGWVGYNWKDVFNPSLPQYAAESEFTLKGRVTNVLNKNLAGTGVQLISSKPAFAMTTLTGKDGSFSFRGFPITDTLSLFIQARNKKEKTFNVGAEVDEFKAPLFKSSGQRFMPWYVNSDTTFLRNIITKAVQEGKISTSGTNLLEEVVITEKKIVKGSKNLNGPGQADQILDEKELAKIPKKTLLDLMQEKIKGFKIGLWPVRNPTPVGLTAGGGNRATIAPAFVQKWGYQIFEKELHLVIDGVDVDTFYEPSPGSEFLPDYIAARNAAWPRDRMNFIRSYLDYIQAEDVKGIEVMHNPHYNSRYKSLFASRYIMSLDMIKTDFAYVEVTTYSGVGFIKREPGTYLYKPMPFAGSATFYKPKYTIKNTTISDSRSTIHWEPYVVTDKEGKAFVSFYSADRKGRYSIVMEGSDMDGNIGRKVEVINVN